MPLPPKSPHPLHRVERVARLLDDAFCIPGTQIKVGLDALIGLIPGVGDAIGLGLGGWFIYEAHRLGAPAALKWQMARNVAIDAISGFVPVLGDVVDVAYRSNRRNLALLRGHFAPLSLTAPASPWGPWLRLATAVGVMASAWWLWLR